MADAFIKFESEWKAVPTTCDPCAACRDIIYGKQYQLVLHTSKSISHTDVNLCEACHSIIIEDQERD